MPLLPAWVWRSLPLAQRTGADIFDRLFRTANPTDSIATLLESPAGVTRLARYSICAGAPRVVNGQPQQWTPAMGEILPFLKRLLERGSQGNAPDLPFTGGWLGWLGYDLAWEIEQLPYLRSDTLPFPVAYWYEPECFAVLDHHTQTLWLAASEPDQLDGMQRRLEQPFDRGIDRLAIDLDLRAIEALSSDPRLAATQAEYETAVIKAKQHIRAGDIFQANLSLRFSISTTVDPWLVYQALHHINPSPFASYWQTPWGSVVSCSPERLVQLQGRQAQTRPIAGTRSRGLTPQQDQQQEQALLNSAKDNAEHIMLVDLERNDLGRVCEWGSVEVDELLAIERYSHVMHLVSNVKGTLSPDADAIDLIRSLFPGGTITGCPKVRCMEIIETLEPTRRNLFYGSCGYLDQRGHLDLNILIRTLLTTPDRSGSIVWGQVGAGIVADSEPEQEWHESLQKAQAQLRALQSAAWLQNARTTG